MQQSRMRSDHELAGGRGVTVCNRWHSVAAFFADMGERPTAKHTIDRVDNNGPYSPENCRWATVKEQASNRRSNKFLTLNDTTMTVSQRAEHLGVKIKSLESRLVRGWSVERTLKTPNRKARK